MIHCFYTDQFVLPLPTGHRFPMAKYQMLRESVQMFAPYSLLEAPAATNDELALAHDPAYIDRMIHGGLSTQEIRAIGFPWSPYMAERARRSAGATVAALKSALTHSAAINLAGGTHHAFRDHGEGFCCFNDAAVAARVIQRDHGISRVLICDLDVHQGNGTASIFAEDNSVFTFSIHGERNYPVRKERSDLDIELPDGCGDASYLDTLSEVLPSIIARFAPNAIIYLAGADPFEGDRLGRLKLTKSGLRQRDEFVLKTARDLGIPIAVTMAGGYAHDLADIVDIHFNTVRTVFEVFA
ncbi:MAG: histone deacetylase [Burkholderiales bacterium]|nr:MAG: histone deacetylase [Burkholderiales bacterium]TAG77886.1 MAG: histone deacetylase [Betaproteobacteria bacterium]